MVRMTGNDLVAQVKKEIKEMSVHQLREELARGAVTLVDIRELDEWMQGKVDGSSHLPRGFLEFQIENIAADRNARLALICAGGVRSALAARSLEEMGYTDVYSIAGGFGTWKNVGYPFSIPRVLDDAQRARYSRHTVMPEMGEDGQLKLLDAKVLLIGAGGLGSPAAIYLAAAGVGTIGLVDFDVVDASNLQRQIIHNLDQIDIPKVDSARENDCQAQSGCQGYRPPGAVDQPKRPRHSTGLRHYPQWFRQLPHSLPGQRRLRPAGQALDRRQYLPF